MRWIAWLLVAACSGGAGGVAHPAAPPAAQPAPPPADEAPSEPECDQLITHAVALGIDEQAAAAPHSTDSDHEAIRRALHDEFLAGCRALPRDAYRCAMAATTLTALAACQRTPSSSTSNSSVAPGGMTRPAPRSP
ncbi:MAG TPA: hypothetical protein VHW23_09160 [Kofleriaceae bacterium]|jgi:hypothetical protein|nr:hypothetical protein [Kofleriaceae bacterium]